MPELVPAIAAATLFALVRLPFREYHYWLSWRLAAFVVIVAGYLGLAGGLAGFVGWLISLAMDPPTSYRWVNGALAGLVGAAAIRIELGATEKPVAPEKQVPAEQTQPKPSPELAPGFSFANATARWALGAADYLVTRAIEDWLKSLGDDGLIDWANEVAKKIDNLEITDSAKKTLWIRFVPAMAELSTATDRASRSQSRSQLEQFCTTYMSQQRWAKPVERTAASI